MRPTDEALAFGAKLLIERKLRTLSSRALIVVEHALVDALVSVESEFWISIVNHDDVLSVESLSFYETTVPDGPKMVATPSFFITFAEKVTANHRHQSARAFLLMHHLLAASGLVNHALVEEERHVFGCSLMHMGGLFGNDVDDNDLDDELCDDLNELLVPAIRTEANSPSDASDMVLSRGARIFAMPKGYFTFRPTGVSGVSKQLEIGIHECKYLRKNVVRAI